MVDQSLVGDTRLLNHTLNLLMLELVVGHVLFSDMMIAFVLFLLKSNRTVACQYLVLDVLASQILSRNENSSNKSHDVTLAEKSEISEKGALPARGLNSKIFLTGKLPLNSTISHN